MQEECRLNSREELDRDILHRLQTMLQDVNPYAQLYENARRCLCTQPVASLSLRLVTLHNKDSRRYNTPTAKVVGAIMVGDGTDTEEKTHDIIVKKKGGPLQVWVVEFQKRGLPHVHMLVILDKESKMRTLDTIDIMVSAELPNITTHPLAYETMTRTMIHGPCGAINLTATCMKDGKCSKRYPREFNNEIDAR